MTTISLFSKSNDFVSFSAGQIIFKEGDPGKVMYAIIEGEVEILIGNKVVDTVSAGNILGEMALIDTSPRSATAVPKTDCKVVPISRRHFTFLVQQTPNFALEVMQVMANRLRRMNAQLELEKKMKMQNLSK
ncbi:cyclic nucleotide-binding domain-containing protein [Candidatus Parabeggiatoa sp. HSG14]|uniref:cyclic nucleotide-binding domain-containing protein n=1 Tax=Candidatus Parabeggiatoa sp. HSG14 TaxID=3055593 RepID=UPI0025A84881|nr:cyclic nucleotide-binding domain-containing protein [Thiotrichales bacterium HSG14]